MKVRNRKSNPHIPVFCFGTCYVYTHIFSTQGFSFIFPFKSITYLSFVIFVFYWVFSQATPAFFKLVNTNELSNVVCLVSVFKFLFTMCVCLVWFPFWHCGVSPFISSVLLQIIKFILNEERNKSSLWGKYARFICYLLRL